MAFEILGTYLWMDIFRLYKQAHLVLWKINKFHNDIASFYHNILFTINFYNHMPNLKFRSSYAQYALETPSLVV